jgi:hypothetical protein
MRLSNLFLVVQNHSFFYKKQLFNMRQQVADEFIFAAQKRKIRGFEGRRPGDASDAPERFTPRCRAAPCPQRPLRI